MDKQDWALLHKICEKEKILQNYDYVMILRLNQNYRLLGGGIFSPNQIFLWVTAMMAW